VKISGNERADAKSHVRAGNINNKLKKLLSDPRRNSHGAKPVWKTVTEAMVGSSESDNMRNNLLVGPRKKTITEAIGPRTPLIWTPPWAPGGDLYRRHDLAMMGSPVGDHTMHNHPGDMGTPPWAPVGDLYRRHDF